MKEQVICRSAEGKAKILTLHDEFIFQLEIEHEDIYVETRYGSKSSKRSLYVKKEKIKKKTFNFFTISPRRCVGV